MTYSIGSSGGRWSGLQVTARRAFGLVAIGLSLTACAKDEEYNGQVAGWSIIEPNQKHPILVSQKPANLSIRVPRGSQGLAASQKSQIVQFLQKYRAADAGNSKIVVSVPSGAPNEVAAMTAVADMRVLFVGGGFSETMVSVEAYYAESDPQPPIKISYLRYVAEAPECGRWPQALGINDGRNHNYHNFGCAQQKNLAVMIANPADLVEPRTRTPVDAARRDMIIDNYHKGQPTGASWSGDEQAVKAN